MNKSKPHTRTGKTLSRLTIRNASWKIPVPTGPMSDAIRCRSKSRLNRTGKNLAKKGKEVPGTWIPNETDARKGLS